MCINRNVRGEQRLPIGKTYKLLGDSETASAKLVGKTQQGLTKFTYVIPARVVIVIVCGDTSDNFNTQFLGG